MVSRLWSGPTAVIVTVMDGRLSPGSGGPLVDPDGLVWTRTARWVDLRVVRRYLRDGNGLVLFGGSGGFQLRWIDDAEHRQALWLRVRDSYRNPRGGAQGDYTGHLFTDGEGRQLCYLEFSC